jgi:hypothetical protein
VARDRAYPTVERPATGVAEGVHVQRQFLWQLTLWSRDGAQDDIRQAKCHGDRGEYRAQRLDRVRILDIDKAQRRTEHRDAKPPRRPPVPWNDGTASARAGRGGDAQGGQYLETGPELGNGLTVGARRLGGKWT